MTCCQRILNLALSEGNNAEERGATLQDHCGAAFQVAHRICSIYATSSFSPATSTHLVIVAPDAGEVAAITVKLFDQTLLADMEMLYMKETVFCVRDGAPLMDHTHPCLAALSDWPPHFTGSRIRTGRRIILWHTGCYSTCLQSSL